MIIFGVDVQSPKDGAGSAAELVTGPCIEAIELLKSNLPQVQIVFQRNIRPLF